MTVIIMACTRKAVDMDACSRAAPLIRRGLLTMRWPIRSACSDWVETEESVETRRRGGVGSEGAKCMKRNANVSQFDERRPVTGR